MTDTKACKKFTGTNFKRWVEKEFAAELRRKKIARVLLASNDPKISHPLPPLLLAEDLGGEPAAAAASTSATPGARASRSSAVTPGASSVSVSDASSNREIQKMLAENRRERSQVQDRHDRWTLECDEAHGCLRQNVYEDAQRRIDNVEPNFALALTALTDYYKDKTVFQKMTGLLQFVNLDFKSGSTAEQHTMLLREKMAAVRTPRADGGYGDAVTIEELGSAVLLNSLQPYAQFDNFIEDTAQKDESKLTFDGLVGDFENSRAGKPGRITVSSPKSSENRESGNRNSRKRAERRETRKSQPRGKFGQDKVQKLLSVDSSVAKQVCALLQGTDSALMTDADQKKYDKGLCFVCGKSGHVKRNCTHPGGGAHDPATWRGPGSGASAMETKIKELTAAVTELSAAQEKLRRSPRLKRRRVQQEEHSSWMLQHYSTKANYRSSAPPLPRELEPAEEHVLASWLTTKVEDILPVTKTGRKVPAGYAAVIRLIADTGASISVLKAKVFDAHATDISSADHISVRSANGVMKANKVGTVCGDVRSDLRQVRPSVIAGVLRSEDLLQDREDIDGLWSVCKAVEAGAEVHWSKECDGGAWVSDPVTGERLRLIRDGNHYILELLIVKDGKQLTMEEKRTHNLNVHRMCGHPGHRRLTETYRRKQVSNFVYYPEAPFVCKICLRKKAQKAKFPNKILTLKDQQGVEHGQVELAESAIRYKPQAVGAESVSDVKGPVTIVSLGDNTFMIVFIDVASHHKCRAYMQSTGHLEKWVEKYRQHLARYGYKMEHFKGDGAYKTEALMEWAAKHGVQMSFSAPYCQSQNGKAEISMKAWTFAVGSAMLDAEVDEYYWCYASDCITDYENRLWTSAAPEMTPHQRFYKVKPDANRWLKPLCSVWYFIYPEQKKHTTQDKSTFANRRANGIFVGFADGHADGAYKVLNPETEKVYVRRFDDVTVDRPSNQYRHQSFAACAEDDCKDFDSFTWDDSESDEEAESKSGESESDASASDSEDEQDEIQSDKKAPETESSESDSSESESEEDASEVAMSESESEADLVETDDEVMQQFSTQDYDGISSDDEDGRQHRSGRVSMVDAFCIDAVETDNIQSEQCEQHAGAGYQAKVKTTKQQSVLAQHAVAFVQAQSGKLAEQKKSSHENSSVNMDNVRDEHVYFQDGIEFANTVNGVEVVPRSWGQAMKGEYASEWKDSDDKEHTKIQSFGSYRRVLRATVDRKRHVGHLLRCLRIKMSGERKTRWCYNGKEEDSNTIQEVKATVMRQQTSRLLNITAVHLKQEVRTGDATNAFLHVEEDEPFLTEPIPGSADAEAGIWLWEWVRCLYGRCKAPFGFRTDMHGHLIAGGFVKGKGDDCTYIHRKWGIKFGLYVDDYEYTGSQKSMNRLEVYMASRYDKTDMGTISDGNQNYVGVRRTVDLQRQILTLDQEEYMEPAIRDLGMWDVKSRDIPGDPNVPLEQVEKEQKIPAKFHKLYRRKVGLIMHWAMVSRPDIAYYAQVASRYLQGPKQSHMEYVDRVIAYIRTTIKRKLIYHCKMGPGATAYISVDAAFADTWDFKSTFGWVIMLCGGAWSWRVGTTPIQGHSSCEVEYIGIDDAVREVDFAERTFEDFDLECPKPWTMLEDNMGAIALCAGPSPHHQRTKHIGLRYHYIREKVKSGQIRMQHQDTEHQVADIFTKALSRVSFARHSAVLLGEVEIKVIAKPLPQSTRIYLELHNQQLAKRVAETQVRAAAGRKSSAEVTAYGASQKMLRTVSQLTKNAVGEDGELSSRRYQFHLMNGARI